MRARDRRTDGQVDGSRRSTENQRLVIKRKGRIRKRIFIILSASEARRVLAIRTQFNVSGEEKGSLLVIPKVISVALRRRWRRYFTALFSPRSTLHYRICRKLQEVHANARQRRERSSRAGAMLKVIPSEVVFGVITERSESSSVMYIISRICTIIFTESANKTLHFCLLSH